MIPAEDITARLLFDTFAAMPSAKRQYGVWVMSKETLDRIKELPEVDRHGPAWNDRPLLFGKPVDIQPEAQGVAFVERQPARDVSAWTVAFTLYEDGGPIHVGAELTDGTYVSGTLLSFADDVQETADRELVLTAPLALRTKDGESHALGNTCTVISARHIVRLDVTHLEKAP
jgi:hypothetical protein